MRPDVIEYPDVRVMADAARQMLNPDEIGDFEREFTELVNEYNTVTGGSDQIDLPGDSDVAGRFITGALGTVIAKRGGQNV